MGRKIVSKIRQASSTIKHTPEEWRKLKTKDIPVNIPKETLEILETFDAIELEALQKTSNILDHTRVTKEVDANGNRQPRDFVTIKVAGSNGHVYKIVVPKSYATQVPKEWEWTQQRYEIAEGISAGVPIKKLAYDYDTNRTSIYGWLQHPEFKEHVDGLTLETGWANKRERIAGLNRVTRLLFDKIINQFEDLKLTGASLGPILVAIQSIAKQIAQEKEEFVEQSHVSSDVNVSGTVGVITANIDTLLASKSSEDRRALEAEFKLAGDDIIRSITGEKD